MRRKYDRLMNEVITQGELVEKLTYETDSLKQAFLAKGGNPRVIDGETELLKNKPLK